MTLSKETIATVTDLIENKLAMMHIADCDDLREKGMLQRALSEVRGTGSVDTCLLGDFADIPRRGRRRKVSDILGESRGERDH
jgi:hypothetical protein